MPMSKTKRMGFGKVNIIVIMIIKEDQSLIQLDLCPVCDNPKQVCIQRTIFDIQSEQNILGNPIKRKSFFFSRYWQNHARIRILFPFDISNQITLTYNLFHLICKALKKIEIISQIH
jgi:hypothetical protein